MKDIITYIKESKAIDEKLMKLIVDEVIETNNIDTDKLSKELQKYDCNMDIILKQLDSPSKKTSLDNLENFANCLWNFLEETYPNESTNYNDYIMQNLCKL